MIMPTLESIQSANQIMPCFELAPWHVVVLDSIASEKFRDPFSGSHILKVVLLSLFV